MDFTLNYTAGSSVLPPPSYDDAVRLGMQTSHRGAQSQMPLSTSASVPPQVLLSSINEYCSSWLYPVMVMVKKTLKLMDQELDSMEDISKPLGQKIQGVQCKSYPAMIVMSLTGMATVVEGDPLTHGMEPWKTSKFVGLFENGKMNWRRNVNYSVLKSALLESMKTLRSWIQEQLALDKEWQHRERQRVPHLQNDEKLKNSMREVTDIIITLCQWRRQHDTDLRLEDFATDFLVKMDMEYLWSFLKRIGDHEKGGNSSTHASAQKESASVGPSLFPSAPEPDGDESASCPQTTQVPAIPSAPSIGMATASCESKSPQQPSTPPLSSVSKYQSSPLYQLLLRLKECIDGTNGALVLIGRMLRGFYDNKINCLNPSQLKDLKDRAMDRVMRSVVENDGDLAQKMDAGLNVKKILTWAEAQDKQEGARVPILSAEERMDMQRSLTTVPDKMKVAYGGFNCMSDQSIFMEALVIKRQLEVFQSLLNRIAKDEWNTVPDF